MGKVHGSIHLFNTMETDTYSAIAGASGPDNVSVTGMHLGTTLAGKVF